MEATNDTTLPGARQDHLLQQNTRINSAFLSHLHCTPETGDNTTTKNRIPDAGRAGSTPGISMRIATGASKPVSRSQHGQSRPSARRVFFPQREARGRVGAFLPGKPAGRVGQAAENGQTKPSSSYNRCMNSVREAYGGDGVGVGMGKESLLSSCELRVPGRQRSSSNLGTDSFSADGPTGIGTGAAMLAQGHGLQPPAESADVIAGKDSVLIGTMLLVVPTKAAESPVSSLSSVSSALSTFR